MFSVDPDVPSIAVTVVTETSVRVSWRVGRTNTVNATYLYHRSTDSGVPIHRWPIVPASLTGTSYTVTSLRTGVRYEFYVKITSYGKNSSSEIANATTGKSHLLVIGLGLLRDCDELLIFTPRVAR